MTVDLMKDHVDDIYSATGIDEALEAPSVFRDADQMVSPSQLGEWAQYVASQREYVAEFLQEAQLKLAIVTAMQKALKDDIEDRIDTRLSEDAATLLNRGFAAQERKAHAKLSQADHMVEVRAGNLQLERLQAKVKELEHVHREWRSAEFTIDRMIRVTQLRLQLAET